MLLRLSLLKGHHILSSIPLFVPLMVLLKCLCKCQLNKWSLVTLSCFSRQLHRQPERLLLHQRQRPALLQESQEPVSPLQLLLPRLTSGPGLTRYRLVLKGGYMEQYLWFSFLLNTSQTVWVSLFWHEGPISLSIVQYVQMANVQFFCCPNSAFSIAMSGLVEYTVCIIIIYKGRPLVSVFDLW